MLYFIYFSLNSFQFLCFQFLVMVTDIIEVTISENPVIISFDTVMNGWFYFMLIIINTNEKNGINTNITVIKSDKNNFCYLDSIFYHLYSCNTQGQGMRKIIYDFIPF